MSFDINKNSSTNILELIFPCQDYMRNYVPFSHGIKNLPTERIHMAPMLGIRYQPNIPPSLHKDSDANVEVYFYFRLSKF